MSKCWFSLVGMFLFLACTSPTANKVSDFDEIIQRAIDSSGTSKFENAIVQFQFRQKTYTSIPTCKGLKLQRAFLKDSIAFQDEMYQGAFNRTKNKAFVQVQDSMANLYTESINSVHYFTQLPFRLKDEAVQKEWVGTEKDGQNEYFKIKVQFQKEGGGEDFEDVYYYWFDSDTYQIKYLAYSFKVNGGGIRFRKAIDQREVNGIRFIDYENYQPNFENPSLENGLKDFLKGKYQFLSTIEKTAILVNEVDLHCD